MWTVGEGQEQEQSYFCAECGKMRTGNALEYPEVCINANGTHQALLCSENCYRKYDQRRKAQIAQSEAARRGGSVKGVGFIHSKGGEDGAFRAR